MALLLRPRPYSRYGRQTQAESISDSERPSSRPCKMTWQTKGRNDSALSNTTAPDSVPFTLPLNYVDTLDLPAVRKIARMEKRHTHMGSELRSRTTSKSTESLTDIARSTPTDPEAALSTISLPAVGSKGQITNVNNDANRRRSWHHCLKAGVERARAISIRDKLPKLRLLHFPRLCKPKSHERLPDDEQSLTESEIYLTRDMPDEWRDDLSAKYRDLKEELCGC